MNTQNSIDLTQYLTDARGRLVPLTSVKEIDLARDGLVKEIVEKAKTINDALRAFRINAHDDIDAFVDLSTERYGVTLGGTKGNLTLTSYDGNLRIQRAISETLGFDERLQAAKSLVDECLQEWATGARPEIKTLINDAFQVDKEGKINTKRVLSLRRLKFDDPKWLLAMEAIADSLTVAVSRSYIRVYIRDEKTGAYTQLNLDLANA